MGWGERKEGGGGGEGRKEEGGGEEREGEGRKKGRGGKRKEEGRGRKKEEEGRGENRPSDVTLATFNRSLTSSRALVARAMPVISHTGIYSAQVK